MKLFFWNGEAIQLGRFGAVKRGDPLMLTDGEARYVEKDRQFRPARKEEGFPSDVCTDQQRREADPERIASMELRDESHDNLLKRCAAMKAQGYSIDFRIRSSRDQLRHAIANAKRQKG